MLSIQLCSIRYAVRGWNLRTGFFCIKVHDVYPEMSQLSRSLRTSYRSVCSDKSCKIEALLKCSRQIKTICSGSGLKNYMHYIIKECSSYKVYSGFLIILKAEGQNFYEMCVFNSLRSKDVWWKIGLCTILEIYFVLMKWNLTWIQFNKGLNTKVIKIKNIEKLQIQSIGPLCTF